jgi:hypothetical protein
VPSDFTLKTMNTVHRLLVTLTRGRAGHEFGGMPVVELTTIGRRSGKPRTEREIPLVVLEPRG